LWKAAIWESAVEAAAQAFIAEGISATGSFMVSIWSFFFVVSGEWRCVYRDCVSWRPTLVCLVPFACSSCEDTV
jgi:hypothetical protein